MDLLKGYGSDSDASSSSSSSNEAATNSAKAKTTATAAKVVVAASKPPQSKTKTPLPNNKNKPTTNKNRGGGKRILSLGAVLPPEIFDRLTRPPEEDDSSTSSFEGAQSKKRKRRPADNDNKDVGVQSSASGGADRSELNSLLSELRSTPLHVSTKDKKSASGKKKQDSAPKTKEVQDEGKLGMAFMSYKSSTTTTTKKSEISEVVNVHASKSAAKKKSIHQPFYTGGAAAPKKKSPPPAVPKPVVPSFTRISGAAPVVKSSVNNSQYSPHGASSMPQYPVTQQEQETNGMNIMEQQAPTTAAASHHNVSESSFNNNSNNTGFPKSRKQKREEERALRSGQAFNNPSATELYQPAPAEFAPSAHAAAIASNAARKIGHAQGGGGSVKNIAMYDPSTGGDVKGLGVTGKHRSKHQINQLMASAISLEAHRASESELARFGAGTGGGGKGSRVDAKKKYGW